MTYDKNEYNKRYQKEKQTFIKIKVTKEFERQYIDACSNLGITNRSEPIRKAVQEVIDRAKK